MVYCSVCKQEISQKEYDYSITHFKKALCREHQEKVNDVIEKKGLTNRESRFREGMIKGRIAEALIEELFLSLGYEVYRYGMENTIPGIMELLKDVRGDVAQNIKRMPDFVIQSPDSKKVFFVEVKFRANETFDETDDSLKDYPYVNCYFIIVSKEHIKCLSYSEIVKEHKKITPTSHNYLGNRKEFELDKDTIIQFCDYATKFFKAV